MKSRIEFELEAIAKDKQDTRRPIAAWELSICFFSGFGVRRDFTISSKWLDIAIQNDIPAAKAFQSQIHKAVEASKQLAIEKGREAPIKENDSSFKNHQVGSPDSAQSLNEGIDQEQFLDADQPSDLLSNHDLGDYDSDSDAESEESHGVRMLLSRDTINAVTESLSDELDGFIGATPDWYKYQNSYGDSLLALAVRTGNFKIVSTLLDHDSVDASVCNDYQESVLHLISTSNFGHEEIYQLVPKLIARGADPHHETLPARYGNHSMNIAAQLRCCSILSAVLSEDLILLSCLLQSIHGSESSVTCRVCEGGSKLKRIVAIALSTFRAEALRIILDHITKHKGKEGIEIKNIEVWSNQQLIPLWKAPFRSVIIKTMDLPEPLFRAVTYGEKHLDVLNSTLIFLFDHFATDSKRLYKMLQEAVETNSLDAVDFILEEAEKRSLPTSWWLAVSATEFPHNPLLATIRIGSRDLLVRLLDANPRAFREYVPVSSEIESFPIPSSRYTKTYYVNVAQICLSIAIVSAHQDQFFL